MPDAIPLPPDEVHPGEKILWTGRRSGWYYLGHWVVALLLAVAVGYGLYTFRVRLERWMPWLYALPFVVLLVTAGIVKASRHQRRYRVTNHRVISEIGIVVQDSNEIRIQDIRSINVLKGGLTGLMGIGRIEFSSAASDDADVIFQQISGADAVRDLVRKLQS